MYPLVARRERLRLDGRRRRLARAILDRFSHLGGNFIDTADSYVGGRSEVSSASGCAQRGNRDQHRVATKVGQHPENPGLGAVSIVRAVEASLERLQTDHIDLLYFHVDDPVVRSKTASPRSKWLIETGKVRYLGASNFSADRLIEARILSSTGLPMVRRCKPTTTSCTAASSRATSASSPRTGPRGHALLRTRERLPHRQVPVEGRPRRQRGGIRCRRTSTAGPRVLAVLDCVAAEHESTPASVAIAWLLAKPQRRRPGRERSRPEQVDASSSPPASASPAPRSLELDRVSE